VRVAPEILEYVSNLATASRSAERLLISASRPGDRSLGQGRPRPGPSCTGGLRSSPRTSSGGGRGGGPPHPARRRLRRGGPGLPGPGGAAARSPSPPDEPRRPRSWIAPVSGALRFSRVHVRLTGPASSTSPSPSPWGWCGELGNNLLYIATSGLLALMSLAGSWPTSTCAASRSAAPPHEGLVYAGRPATLTLEAHQHQARPSFLLTAAGRRSRGQVEIPPGGKALIPIEILFPLRGRGKVGTLTVLSLFPSHVHRGGSFDPGLTCVVYPAPRRCRGCSRARRAPRRGAVLPVAGPAGTTAASRVPPGTPLTPDHWKGWLRHRRLMSKEFESEGPGRSTSASTRCPGRVWSKRCRSSHGWCAPSCGEGGGGAHPSGRELPPAAGSAHRQQLLTALALFGEGPMRARSLTWS